VVAQCIQYFLEQIGFMDNQFSGRVGQSHDDVPMSFTSIVWDIKHHGQVAAVLSVDISNFYGSLVH
jgi:hypothetical protein